MVGWEVQQVSHCHTDTGPKACHMTTQTRPQGLSHDHTLYFVENKLPDLSG